MSTSPHQTNVSHRAKRTGIAAQRKKERQQLKAGTTPVKKPQNLKAFTFSSIVAAQRNRIQAAEVEHRRHHGHMERKDLVGNPPPKIIAVAGPPGSGKSTLIKCLVKHFTRTPTFDCIGPVSCIVDNNTRITFVEVPNDIGAMIDSAKTADMVLLTIDASFGFELETFEYLNILKTHGFPKVFGVLTHVDHFRTNAALSRIKKKMKKRFQQEVVDGSKFFHVSGLIHGRYPRREVLNIGRYISVTKPKPHQFRNEHPYIVCDRIEDMTHPGLIHNNPVCDRTVALYGYVRGCSMKTGQNVHLLGVGDFQVKDLEVLDDPLPLLRHLKNDTQDDKEKRRTLKKQNIKVHAPFSDIGSVMYDKDAVYIKMRSHKVRVSNAEDLTMLGSQSKNSETDLLQQRLDVERRLNKINEHEAFIKSLQEKYHIGVDDGKNRGEGKLDDLLQSHTKISLFGDNASITSKQFEELNKYRQGSTALPDDALNIDEEEKDPNALGCHDVNDDDLLFGGARNNTNTHSLNHNGDDFYNRITIKEVVGADGRVRKQVVFNNSLPDEDGMNDHDSDDSDHDISNYNDTDDDNTHYSPDDDDDGYYSLDEEDMNDANTDDDDDDDYMYGEGEFDYHDLFSQFEGDEEGEECQNLGYGEDDFPDHDFDDEDHSDEYEYEDAMDGDELVQLGSVPCSSPSFKQPTPYDLSKFIKGGTTGVYASLNNIGSLNGNGNDNDITRSNSYFLQRNQASCYNALSLNDLVYGSKETLFQTNVGLFGDNNNENNNTHNNPRPYPSLNHDSTDNGQDDDFFVMKHNIKQTLLGHRGDEDDGITHVNAGRVVYNQSTFATSTATTMNASNPHISPHHNVTIFDNMITIDTTFVLSNERMLSDWMDDGIRNCLRNRFVTGDWSATSEKYDGKDNNKNDSIEIPEDYLTDDESLSHDEKKKRRQLRLEWQRKTAFDVERDINQSWGDDAFGKRKKQNKPNLHGADERMFDHDEQLFGDFEEIGSDDDPDDGNNNRDGSTETKDFNMRKHIEDKLRKKQGFLGLNLDAMEKEAQNDQADEERQRLEAKLGKDNRGHKKLAMNKQILRDHFDYFSAQHQFIMEKVEKNKAEMAKLSDAEKLILFGVLPGTYVRILLTQVPCEFIEHLEPQYPIVLGGLQPTEQNMGFLNMRVKKHRWFHRLLKSNDPLIFSSGWRRFQSIPSYYIEDATGRHRYLKYTPEHLHCLATTYAPLVTVNSGIIAFKNVYMASKSIDMANKSVSTFRIALTGVVLDVDKKLEIRKKLKLIGTPLQIFNKTAYIQGMFNSTLEVAKFEGARIQTVSGIPGRIVKALTHEGKEGCFRATFNDKIVKSDLIICKTFASVKTYRYYNPVTSLLLANKSGWKGMRTTKEMRADKGEVIKHSKDNEYVDIVREKRQFTALKIPAQLAAQLPFKSKQKIDSSTEFALAVKKKKESLLKKRQLSSEKVDEIIKRRKHSKKSYDDVRNKFADKKTVKHAGFVAQLQELSAVAKKTGDINKRKKRAKVVGETAENRERIERMKQNNKQRKFQMEARKKESRAAAANKGRNKK